jgi:hypothetical protein
MGQTQPSPQTLLHFFKLNKMKSEDLNVHGRVRKNTSREKNREIDQKVLDSMLIYKDRSAEDITCRLEELKKEWDIEKTLEVNASAFALTGIILGTLVSKKWFLLPGIVSGFLLQHGLQGWCPPLPLFRAMGIRSRQEIDEEIYALKILRGDFDNVTSESHPSEIIDSLRGNQLSAI